MLYGKFVTAAVAALVCAAPGFAWGQYDHPTGFAAPVGAPAFGQAPEQALLVSAQVPVDDLAARVKKLEEALKKAEDKAAADKKQAASRPTYKLLGRTFVDFTTFSQDAENKAVYGNAKNGIGFRAVWLGLEGEIFDVFSYKTEFDFVGAINNPETGALIGNGVTFKEVWMGVHDLPWLQNARVGHFKEPFSLEELTSTKYITFMERSMIHQAVVPAYNLGGMISGQSCNERVLWQTGLFQNDIDDRFVSRTADDLAGAWTSRIVWLPWYDECTDGRGLLHLGAAYSYRDAFGNAHRFRAQPSARFGAPYVVDAGNPLLEDYQLGGLEAALVYGPFSIQSEYINAWLEPAGGATDQNIWGFYVQVSYFLTGENRAYRRDTGRFDRVRPFENFFRVRAEDGCIYTGKGAWELAYRYDYIDATDVSLAAGLASNHTFGVNWYLSPYNRIMWNYIHCEPERNGASAGTLDAFEMRFQVDF